MSSPSIKARLRTTGHVVRNDHSCETFSYARGVNTPHREVELGLACFARRQQGMEDTHESSFGNRLLWHCCSASRRRLLLRIQGSSRPGPAFRRKPRKRRPCRRRVAPIRPVARLSKVRLRQIQRPATRTPPKGRQHARQRDGPVDAAPRSRARLLPGRRLRAPQSLIPTIRRGAGDGAELASSGAMQDGRNRDRARSRFPCFAAVNRLRGGSFEVSRRILPLLSSVSA